MHRLTFLNLCAGIRDPPLPCTLVLGWALCSFLGFFTSQSSVLCSSPSLSFDLGQNHTTAIIRRSCQLLAGSGLCAGRTQRQLSFPALVIIYQVEWTIICQKFVTQPTLAALNGYQAWHKDHFATNTKSFSQNMLQQGISREDQPHSTSKAAWAADQRKGLCLFSWLWWDPTCRAVLSPQHRRVF